MIYCSALGNPAPQFKWSRKDGRRLDWRLSQLANGSRGIYIQPENGSRGRFIQSTNESRGRFIESTNESRRIFIQLANGSLKVEPIWREDSGSYTCTIKQSRGSDSVSEKSQSITVRVIGKMKKDKNNKKTKTKQSQKSSAKGINALFLCVALNVGNAAACQKKGKEM